MRVVTIARKPLSESTVAGNVLKHGCGALNIDASRIRVGAQPSPTTAPGWDSINKSNAEGGYRPKDYNQGDASYVPSPSGRWPANLILVHSEGCREVGTTRISVGGGSLPMRVTSQGSVYRLGHAPMLKHNYRENGTEIVPNWACTSDCPVAELDSITSSSTGTRGKPHVQISAVNTPFTRGKDAPEYTDAGSPSRFFKQVKPRSG